MERKQGALRTSTRALSVMIPSAPTPAPTRPPTCTSPLPPLPPPAAATAAAEGANRLEEPVTGPPMVLTTPVCASNESNRQRTANKSANTSRSSRFTTFSSSLRSRIARAGDYEMGLLVRTGMRYGH